MQTLNPKRTKWVTALWEVDPTGERPARRLTRSAKGEGGAAFLPDGSLLFTSARPDPRRRGRRRGRRCSGCCPAGGGEARVVATRPGGVDRVEVAADAGTVVLASKTFPSSDSDEESEAEKRKERKEKKVAAILHEQRAGAVLGPRPRPRRARGCSPARWPTPSAGDDAELELTDLTPDAGPRAGRGGVRRQPRRLDRRHDLGAARAGRHCAYALALIDVATR